MSPKRHDRLPQAAQGLHGPDDLNAPNVRPRRVIGKMAMPFHGSPSAPDMVPSLTGKLGLGIDGFAAQGLGQLGPSCRPRLSTNKRLSYRVKRTCLPRRS